MSADKKWGIARDTDSINGDVVGDIDVVGTVQNQGALNQANERAMIKCGPPSHTALMADRTSSTLSSLS